MRRFPLALAFFTALILVSGCASHAGEQPAPKKYSSFNLPISERSFYIGMVPTPKNIPGSSFDDIIDAVEESSKIGEVTMVWTEPSGIGQHARLAENRVITGARVFGLKPVISLGFATIKEVPGEGLKYVIDAPEEVTPSLSKGEFRKLWKEEAVKIARDFKPEYLSLGNEINDYFYLNPGQLDDYLSLFDETYSAVKEVSPNTKVFVVFSYTHLIDNSQWDFFEKFDSRADLIGLTTYPRKHFSKPSGIPKDYYSRVSTYTGKPIAFTEIGWPSDAASESSETEQAEFLLRFLALTKGMKLEMANWLFLHETDLSGIAGSVTSPATATISLRNKDGSKKEIYNAWLDLYSLANGQ